MDLYSKRSTFLIFVTFSLVLTYLYIRSSDISSSLCTRTSISTDNVRNAFKFHINRLPAKFCLRPLVKRAKKCLAKTMKESDHDRFWKNFMPSVDKCTKYLMETLRTKILHNKDDIKHVILPSNRSDDCTAVTIGIGNDIEAEEKLAQLLPQCKFFGADAIYETGRIFEQIGTFFHTAVGSGNSTIHTRVLTNETYENMDLKSTDFYDLLEMTNAKMIDYLFLDAEGAEYNILPMLQESKLRQRPICQMSVELHGVDGFYNVSDAKFGEIIRDLLLNGVHIPVWAHTDFFSRTFWIDFQSKECVEKFFADFCHY